MNTEQMQSEIADLNGQLESMTEPRQCYLLVQERIRQYRAAGWTIPEEIQMMERQLMVECLAESQGR
jgi:hypothetical protein